jgi:hypothetical protein
MKNSATKQDPVFAVDVIVTTDTLTVELSDGRRLSTPLSWFPRLVHGTEAERGHWELQCRGTGIHWPELDEDISVEGLIAGHPSYESESSLERWMNGRQGAR